MELVKEAAAVNELILGAGAVTAIVDVTNNFVNATMNSLFMIIATEIGDKTFFIAAILAMRHGRLVVYAGAMMALAVMHMLSSMMGFALPALMPRQYTHFASAVRPHPIAVSWTRRMTLPLPLF
jgi:hypothetical protein